MNLDTHLLRRLQIKFWTGAAALAPLAPFLYMQAVVTRWKVGLLPDAAGPFHGTAGSEGNQETLLVLGESTVAGLGARDHERGLAGQFAGYLAAARHSTINWHVLGKAGVTARRTIDELLPHVPDLEFDHILLGLGGNDVMKLSPPSRFRRDMAELIGRLRERSPRASFYMSNCPMIILSPVIPWPSKQLLWELSKMHDLNMREMASILGGVQYFPQPVDVEPEGFFADGIHPSERGYRDWAEAMVRYFTQAKR